MNIREQGLLSETIMLIIFFYHSNFRKPAPDSDGHKRCIQAAAVNTNFPCAVPNKRIDQTAVSDVGRPRTVRFEDYYLHYSTIILQLFYQLYSLFQKTKLLFGLVFIA